jgi:hypothetical protein
MERASVEVSVVGSSVWSEWGGWSAIQRVKLETSKIYVPKKSLT